MRDKAMAKKARLASSTTMMLTVTTRIGQVQQKRR